MNALYISSQQLCDTSYSAVQDGNNVLMCKAAASRSDPQEAVQNIVVDIPGVRIAFGILPKVTWVSPLPHYW